MRCLVTFVMVCAGVAACSDAEVPVCVVGQSNSCACTDGRPGAQICEAGGTYGACVCADPPDGGVVAADSGTIIPPVPDSGVGPRPTEGTEGYECRAAAGGDTPCDDGLECFSMSEDNAEVLDVCILRCQSDDECATSSVGNTLCREIRFGGDACVSAEVGEGETAELSLRRGGPMTGCDDELSAGGTYLVGVSRRVGSGLWDLEHDQSSCVRQCDPNDPADCTARAPFCNTPFFNSQERPGVCNVARKQAGATCSRADATKMCSRDSDQDGRLVCWDYLRMFEDPALGQCHQLCSLAGQDCKNAHDPSKNPRCVDTGVSSTSGDVGMCSEGCSRYPDDCDGPGEHAEGQICFPAFLTTSTTPRDFDNPHVAFCYDVQPPVHRPWQSTMDPGDNCYESRLSCPARTYCETSGFPGNLGACMFGCTTATTATVTGCEMAPVTTCAKAHGDEFDAGRCAPF